MKKKESTWFHNWYGMSITFILYAIIGKLPFWGSYVRPVLDSMVLTFGVLSIISGILFLVYRRKAYLEYLEEERNK